MSHPKKIKTRKGAAKRFWLSGSGKLRRRQSGQDHFNSRDRQKISKGKRKTEISTSDNARIKQLIPYK
jgi:ribosomal protein L35